MSYLQRLVQDWWKPVNMTADGELDTLKTIADIGEWKCGKAIISSLTLLPKHVICLCKRFELVSLV